MQWRRRLVFERRRLVTVSFQTQGARWVLRSGVDSWFDQNFDAVLLSPVLNPPRKAVFGGYWRDVICKAPASVDESPS